MVDMGSRLRQLRKQHKLTQKQVAERTGLAVSAISSYESGSRCPTYETLRKLATMYHVSCDFLVGMPSTRTIDVSGLSDSEIAVLTQTADIFRNKRSQ